MDDEDDEEGERAPSSYGDAPLPPPLPPPEPASNGGGATSPSFSTAANGSNNNAATAGGAGDPAGFDIPAGMDEESFMAQLMGFGGFGSTKGQHVEDNDKSAARGACAKPLLKREYRQYMHRKGGFNRELAPQQPIKRRGGGGGTSGGGGDK